MPPRLESAYIPPQPGGREIEGAEQYPKGGRRPEDTREVAPAGDVGGQDATPLRPVLGAQPPS